MNKLSQIVRHNCTVERMLQTRILAIVFWGRSGSMFLGSLLDSHPQVLTFPLTLLQSFYGYQWPRIVAATAGRPSKARATVAELVCSMNQPAFDGTAWLGKNKSEAISVDKDRFKEYLLALLDQFEQVDSKSLFLSLHYAYELARELDISQKEVINFQLHNPESYTQLSSALLDFPDLKAVGIFREPLRAFSSHLVEARRCMRELWKAPDADYCDLVSVRNGPEDTFNKYYRHQLIGWTNVTRHFGVPLLELKHEELHTDPEGITRRLAKWAGIEWKECLLEGTWNGLQYWSTSHSTGSTIAGFSISLLNKSVESQFLDRLDSFVMRGLLRTYLLEKGYLSVPVWQSVLSYALGLLPMRIERRALQKAFHSRSLSDLASTLASICYRQISVLRYLLGLEVSMLSMTGWDLKSCLHLSDRKINLRLNIVKFLHNQGDSRWMSLVIADPEVNGSLARFMQVQEGTRLLNLAETSDTDLPAQVGKFAALWREGAFSKAVVLVNNEGQQRILEKTLSPLGIELLSCGNSDSSEWLKCFPIWARLQLRAITVKNRARQRVNKNTRDSNIYRLAIAPANDLVHHIVSQMESEIGGIHIFDQNPAKPYPRTIHSYAELGRGEFDQILIASPSFGEDIKKTMIRHGVKPGKIRRLL